MDEQTLLGIGTALALIFVVYNIPKISDFFDSGKHKKPHVKH